MCLKIMADGSPFGVVCTVMSVAKLSLVSLTVGTPVSLVEVMWASSVGIINWNSIFLQYLRNTVLEE